MEATLILWKDDKVITTIAVRDKDKDAVFVSAVNELLNILEPLADNDRELEDLRYATDMITRWRYEEKFGAGIEPIVPQPSWKGYTWDFVPAKIIEEKEVSEND